MTNREVSISEMKIGSAGCEAFAQDVEISQDVLFSHYVSVGQFYCRHSQDATCALNGLMSAALKCPLNREDSKDTPTMHALTSDALTTIRAELGCMRPETPQD
jgi:hypothetical protein